MEELIKINWPDETVMASDLWEYLDKPHGRFNMWVQRYLFHENYGLSEGRDFHREHKNVHPVRDESGKIVGNEKQADYRLTLDCAKELAMLARSKKGKEAREYFLKCEKMLKQAHRIWEDRQYSLFDFPLSSDEKERKIKTLSAILNAISGKGFSQEELRILSIFFAQQLGIELSEILAKPQSFK